MRPAQHEHTPTVFEVVRRAVDVVDPAGKADTGDFLLRFEDRDEPVAGVQESIEQEIAEAVGAFDPDGTDPVIQLVGAVATYLAFRRDEVTDVREDILRLAARAEYDGHPPAHVRAWLESQGVAV
jgi:hypothetical protein